jgi:hypothetical protein
MDYIFILIAGFGGGAVRGLIGFLKHQYSYKKVEFDLKYFIFMTFLSGAIGLIVSAVIYGSGTTFVTVLFVSPAISFVIGYAGGDFVEGLYKIIIKKPSA